MFSAEKSRPIFWSKDDGQEVKNMSNGKQLFSAPRWDSRIKSANIQKSEKWLGYFAAPALIMCMFYMCGQTYLNTFYTDVLKMSSIGGGLFLAILPVVSKVIDAITNVIMGQIVERTRSRQGKARPWILISGPLLTISGILLFTVPTSSITAQVIWVTVSYNLYFCLAFTMYNISHTLMVPLSTRNGKQRDTLAMFTSMGSSMIPGAIISMLFPMLILPIINVDQGKWITVMGIISILALPAVFLEYYFTRERVTEESIGEAEEKKLSFGEQLKGCFKSQYWIVIMGVIIVYNLYNNFQVTSSLYYANWVLGKYNDGTTYTIMNAVGQAPLGLGVFLLWPLVRKIGKSKCMIAGSALAIIGNVLCIIAPKSMGTVLGGLALRSIGALPITYVLMSMLADALDHVEWINGFRCDGFSSSIYSIILTVTTGISTGIFNLFLGKVNYIPPLADGTVVEQTAAVQNYFVTGYFIVPAVGAFLVGLLCAFYRVDKELPQIQKDIEQRHREEAKARGEVYLSPEEKAAQEQEELERIAEEKRIEELKAMCAKKGLSFEEEEAKYQAQKDKEKRKSEKKPKKKAKKSTKIIIGIIVAVILIQTPLLILWKSGKFAAGNADRYSVAQAETLPDSQLNGKTIVFLGSSVTVGSAAESESFVEFMEKRDGINPIKEAVSGTTLVDNGDKSYISRLKKMDTEIQPDAFVCQLSTNDATRKLTLGDIAEGTDPDSFDTDTITGALEYIISYARETWDCPVIFYTGTKYNSQAYEAMVSRLLELQEKWNIVVIDLWNDPDMNAVSEEDYKLYMFDSIHPTRAGYRDWWTPKFEAALISVFQDE